MKYDDEGNREEQTLEMPWKIKTMIITFSRKVLFSLWIFYACNDCCLNQTEGIEWKNRWEIKQLHPKWMKLIEADWREKFK